MIFGGWRVSWWSDGVGVVGVGAGRGLRLGGRRFRTCHSWLVVGRLVVLVVPVVSGVGVFLSAVLGSVVVGVAPVVVEGVDAVDGWLCRCVAAVAGAGDSVGEGAASGTLGVGAAGDAEGEGVVGDALVDGADGRSGAASGGGTSPLLAEVPMGVAGRCVGPDPPLVSLMPMVLYRVVSPWWLSLTLRVAVAEVALSVVVSVTPLVRSLRALLWFTASLMLLMLLVVGVGLCLGGQWPVLGGGRWLVPVALSGRVCSRWCGLLVMPLVRVVQALPRLISWVRVVLVALMVLVPLVTVWWMAPCGCFGGEGVVVDGSGRVPSPPLAGAWWFVGSPVVVALVASGGGGCRWRR